MSSTKKTKTEKLEEASSDSDSATTKGYDPYKQSNLFHEVYLNIDVPQKFKNIWDIGEEGDFGRFCGDFRDLCAKYDSADFDSWSEMDTIQNWITPILRMLGYFDKCDRLDHPFSLDTAFTFQDKILKPDYIIVDRPSDLTYIKNADNSSEEKLQQAREYVKLTVEAKYWDRLEEYRQNKSEDKKKSDNKKPSSNEPKDPVEQTLEYMEMLHNDWGILTDGKVWRLYHRELSSDSHKRCFQFNLGYLARYAKNPTEIGGEEYKSFIENAKFFYFLFNKSALFGKDGKGKIVDHLVEYSKDYVHKIEEDLRSRFVQAMTIFCNGLHESMGKPSSEDKLDLVRNVAESFLFNIMFIKSCESRLILPMKGDYSVRSLTRIVQCLKKYKSERGLDEHNLECLQKTFGNASDENSFNFSWDGTELYERLLDIAEFVQKGTNSKFKNFKIEGFTETVFTTDEWTTAKKFKIKNKYIVPALFEIGFARPDAKINKYQQIPYNFFTARQLGSIYESFLEFKLKIAESDLILKNQTWEQANLKSDKVRSLTVPKVAKSQIYFTRDSQDRHSTGSYYTPDYIVQFIVKETLEPLILDKSSKEILEIKICDPAMGSGHFVNAVLNYLSRIYMTKLEQETNDDLNLSLSAIKLLILNKCCYGVDVNPRAVKLAKMGLWLESANPGKPLERLDDQLKTADSLIGWPFKKKFNSFLGNPPYIDIITIPDEYRRQLEKKFTTLNYRSDIYSAFVTTASGTVAVI